METAFVVQGDQVRLQSSAPTPTPTCDPNFHSIAITVNTQIWGSEMQWEITDDCHSGGSLADYSTFTTHCCLEEQNYILQCQDTYGDGWHNNSIIVEGVSFCQGFLSGFIEEHRITVTEDGGIIAQEQQCEDGEIYDVQLVTSSFADEISWHVNDNCRSQIRYDSHTVYETVCCIPDGATLTCRDQLGDGWHGAYISFNGVHFCEDFDSGMSHTEQLTEGTLATTTMATTLSPCGFGYDGPDCQVEVDVIMTTMSFNGMSLDQFYEAEEQMLQGAADLLSDLGITLRDVQYGDPNIITRRRRLAFLEANLYTEVKPGQTRETTAASLNDDEFEKGMTNLFSAMPGMGGVEILGLQVAEEPIRQ